MSLVPCKCIDDSNRPSQIPPEKWIAKDEEYRILGLYVHVNQNRIQGVTLVEKPLDHTNRPYETFRLNRFTFNLEDIPALIQLARDCTDLQGLNDVDLERLIKEQVPEEEHYCPSH